MCAFICFVCDIIQCWLMLISQQAQCVDVDLVKFVLMVCIKHIREMLLCDTV